MYTRGLIGGEEVTFSVENQDQAIIENLLFFSSFALSRNEVLSFSNEKNFLFQIQSCIHAAWLWTIEQHMGMFTPDKEEVNPLALSESYDKTNQTPNVGPHDIWLEFLVNRFKAISYYSRTQARFHF